MIRAEEEAAAIVAHVGTDGDPARVEALVRRRESGEPLARILGVAELCGLAVRIHPGVYVPRWTTASIARAASGLLPDDGTAVDLCTGCGAVAAVLQRDHPAARVLATDIDPASVECARANGVDAHLGDLFAPLPRHIRGGVDVVVAVPPFVPHDELDVLPADVRAHERTTALDGGRAGLEVVGRIAAEVAAWLRPSGAVVIEVGDAQVDAVVEVLASEGLDRLVAVVDDDGDRCGVIGRRPV